MTSRSVDDLRNAIERLPSDDPQVTPGKCYLTQKEHWLGWLGEYSGPGAYGRSGGENRDARFVYNHIVEPKMLTWLIQAAGAPPEITSAAKEAEAMGGPMQRRSAAIRRIVPWNVMAALLWGR